jgi:acetate kinase
VLQTIFRHAQQVAVFDTAFHGTLPPKAFMYAIPYELYEKCHIRKYGFHGISHLYLARQAAQQLRRSVDTPDPLTTIFFAQRQLLRGMRVQ